MIIKTNISYGYLTLIKTFMHANNLDLKIQDMSAYPHGKVILEYDDDSDTATTLTFMSYKHLGLENMLCDYLIRCGVDPILISVGVATQPNRNMKELDKQWEDHRRLIGFR